MKQIMNKTTALNLLIFLFCRIGMMYGQIEVYNDNTVKITENVTVTRNDTDNPRLQTSFTFNVPNSTEAYSMRNYSYGTSRNLSLIHI